MGSTSPSDALRLVLRSASCVHRDAKAFPRMPTTPRTASVDEMGTVLLGQSNRWVASYQPIGSTRCSGLALDLRVAPEGAERRSRRARPGRPAHAVRLALRRCAHRDRDARTLHAVSEAAKARTFGQALLPQENRKVVPSPGVLSSVIRMAKSLKGRTAIKITWAGAVSDQATAWSKGQRPAGHCSTQQTCNRAIAAALALRPRWPGLVHRPRP